MGPLVPEIISSEFNLIIAFLIGIGFGFALEQAGFSSTRKLVGLFYGYDFTVLKVFFTAGVTAMVGVLILSHFGFLDLRFIYINPTFLRSALVGGAIMGLGFILGGFCPGTSICAASVGKIDAWAFIGGSVIGVLVFTELFPYFESFYFADNMGALTMDAFLNITKETFAFIMIIVAISAFYFTSIIEKKVNGLPIQHNTGKALRYSVIAIIPFLTLSFTLLTPDYKEAIIRKANHSLENNVQTPSMDADKLADELLHHHHKYNIIDVRDTTAFNDFNIPSAVNMPLDSMFKKEWKHLFQQPYKTNIFYADDPEIARKAVFIANRLGEAENYALIEGALEFKQKFFEPILPPPSISKKELDLYRFRVRAGKELRELEEKLKNTRQPVKKEIKKVQGGCA